MAQSKRVKIELLPAKPTSFGGIEIKMSLGQKDTPEKTIEASTTAEIIAATAAFAAEHGKPCAAFVRVLDKARKPAGFDEATRHLYYNLDTPAAASA